jgi:hypothetical protein
MSVSPAAPAASQLEPVRPFASLGREDVDYAGGKGANLGELTAAGLPVPDMRRAEQIADVLRRLPAPADRRVVALGAVGPRIAQILGALVPVILVTAIAAAVLRVVWFYTRRW